MATEPGSSPFDSPSRPLSGRVLMLAALAAFIAGGALVGWVMWYNLQPGRPGAPRPEVVAEAGVGAADIDGDKPGRHSPASASMADPPRSALSAWRRNIAKSSRPMP